MARKPILPDENGEYTEAQLEKLKARALNSATWHLGQRPQTTKEIEDKLRKKLIPNDIIQETISKLTEAGWLNDAVYAENYIHSKRTYEKLGVSVIRLKLLRKGVDRELLDSLLEDISSEELEETALELARKKNRQLKREPDRDKRVQKIVSNLAYRGYNASVAYRIAQKVVDENNDEQQ